MGISHVDIQDCSCMCMEWLKIRDYIASRCLGRILNYRNHENTFLVLAFNASTLGPLLSVLPSLSLQKYRFFVLGFLTLKLPHEYYDHPKKNILHTFASHYSHCQPTNQNHSSYPYPRTTKTNILYLVLTSILIVSFSLFISSPSILPFLLLYISCFVTLAFYCFPIFYFIPGIHSYIYTLLQSCLLWV